MSPQKAQVLRGFRDYLPEQMVLRQHVIGIFRDVFELHGFEPLDTPALEYLETLTGKAGENEKLMYHFEDQGGREVGMRYDLTVPLARVVAQHQNEIVVPFKRYHIAPVWRAEKPQRGRFREFWQCDADIVGSPSMLADAECVSVMAEALHEVGLSAAVVSINHRKLLEAMARLAGVPAEQAPTVYRAVDKLAKIGPDGVRAELVRSGVTDGAAGRVLELVTLQGETDTLLDEADRQLTDINGGPEAVAELRQLVGFIQQLGVPTPAYRVDFALARGLDYYTGPVFEALVEEPKIGSVGGAGRYDTLVGSLSGRDVPATGMSLGIERILEVIQEFDLLPISRTTTDVFLASFPDTLTEASVIARQLRDKGLKVDQSVAINRGLGDQLRYADRKGVRFAIIPGKAELERGMVSVKDLVSGEQREIERQELAVEFMSLLQRES